MNVLKIFLLKSPALRLRMLLLVCWLAGFLNTFAQDAPSLLDELEEEQPVTEHVRYAFKSPRVINGHSMEMLHEGVLDFRILHRFGSISDGYYQLFGLDNATMRIGFDYGLTPNLTAGFGRSTHLKELDGFIKYRLLWQSTGKRPMPLSVIWVSGLTFNGLKDPTGDPNYPPSLSRRMSYYHMLILGRKFSERFTLQLSPTFVHRNIVENQITPNDLYALSIGGRFKISNRVALVWDYGHVLNRVSSNTTANPLSIGFDIETGGHIFQLHFSNATGMNERAFLSDINGDWLRSDIRFGFNLSRVFQVSSKK